MSLIIPEYIQITKIDQKHIVLDCRENYFYAVTESGAMLLDQIQIHGDKKKAMETISLHYHVSIEKIEKDLTTFFDHLLEKGLIMKT